MIPCCVVILTLLFLPETPYWLIENNQFEEAKKSLKFFRGTNYDTSSELEEIHQKHLSKPKSQTFTWVMRRLFSQAFFRPFLCIGMLEILFSISGFEVVTLYMHRILETTQSSIDPALGPVITGVVRVISAGTNLDMFSNFCIHDFFYLGQATYYCLLLITDLS